MVRFYFIDDRHCNVFISNLVCKINLDDTNDLELLLKKIVKFMDSNYSFSVSGLFDVNIYVNEKVGMLVEFEKTSSIISYKNIELKLNIIYDDAFYFKTDCFECLEKLKGIYFSEGYYYISIDNIDKIDKYIEFGDIIYDNKLCLSNNFIKIK